MLRSRYNCADDILTGLADADLYDKCYLEAARRHVDAIVPKLKKIAAGDKPSSLKASYLLLLIGQADGLEGLIAKIGGHDPALRLKAMERLAVLPFHSKQGGYQVPLDKAAVLAVVMPLLKSSELRIPVLALDILMRLGTPEADAAVMSCINAPKPETRMDIARWLGGKGLDNGALNIVDELLFHPPAMQPDRYDNLLYGLVHTLEDLCKHGSGDARLRACSLAMRFIRENRGRSDNKMANYISACLKAVAAVAPLNEPQLLKDVLASSIEWWARGVALTRLAEIEGEDGFVRLCEALKDPNLRVPAAEGLAELAKRTSDPKVIEAAASVLEAEESHQVIAQMIKAFLSAGGASHPILQRVLERADPATAMTIHWVLEGIAPHEAVEQLITAGVTPPPSKDEMESYEKLWNEHWDARGVVFYIAFVGGTLTDVVTKTGEVPADHAAAINSLCAKTRGAFEVTDLHQREAEDGKLEVGFMYEGRHQTFEVNRFGGYLDMPAILNGLNRLLENIGHESRFFQIKCEGEVALVIFASASEFPKAAQRLRIPLETDHDAPRQAGIAYTNHVLTVIDGGRRN